MDGIEFRRESGRGQCVLVTEEEIEGIVFRLEDEAEDADDDPPYAQVTPVLLEMAVLGMDGVEGAWQISDVDAAAIRWVLEDMLSRGQLSPALTNLLELVSRE